jgi:hypothetical protein
MHCFLQIYPVFQSVLKRVYLEVSSVFTNLMQATVELRITHAFHINN